MTVADVLRAAQWVPGVVNAALALVERRLDERAARKRHLDEQRTAIYALDPSVFGGVCAFIYWAAITSAPEEEQGAYGVCCFFVALQYQAQDVIVGVSLSPAELEALQNR